MFGLVLQPIFQDLGDGHENENGQLPRITADDLYSMWLVATKAKRSIPEGHRLENLSWRLWYSSRQSHSLSTIHPPPSSSSPSSSSRKLPLDTVSDKALNPNHSVPDSDASITEKSDELIMDFKKSEAKDIPFHKSQLDKTSIAIFQDIQMAAQKVSLNLSTSLPEKLFSNNNSNSDNANKESPELYNNSGINGNNNGQINNNNGNNNNSNNNGNNNSNSNIITNDCINGNSNTARRRRKNIDKYFAKIKQERKNSQNNQNDNDDNNNNNENNENNNSLNDGSNDNSKIMENCRLKSENDPSSSTIINSDSDHQTSSPLLSSLSSKGKEESEREKKEQDNKGAPVRRSTISRGFQPSNCKSYFDEAVNSSSIKSDNNHKNDVSLLSVLLSNKQMTNHASSSCADLMYVLGRSNSVTGGTGAIDGKMSSESGGGNNQPQPVCCSPPIRPPGPVPSVSDKIKSDNDSSNGNDGNFSNAMNRSIISFESMNTSIAADTNNNDCASGIGENSSSNDGSNNDNNSVISGGNAKGNGTINGNNNNNNGNGNSNNRHERRRRNSPSSSSSPNNNNNNNNNNRNINAEVEAPLFIW